MAPQITNISAAATNSSGSITGIVRNSNNIRGQSNSSGATMYASAKNISTAINPRISAVITSTNRIRVQTATVGGGTLTTTTGSTGSSLTVSTRLNDLYDVELVGATDGSFLVYNSANDYWTYTNEIYGGTF